MKNFLKHHRNDIFFALICIVVTVVFTFLPKWVLPADVYSEEENLLDVISIHISLYSLEASVIIAFLIFGMENRRSEREKRNRENIAKRLMLAAIEDGVHWLISSPDERVSGSSRSIKQIFSEYRDDLLSSLPTSNYNHLEKVVSAIDSFVNENYQQNDYQTIWTIFPQWIDMIRNSPFVEYMFLACDEYALLTSSMVDLLKNLGSDPKVHPDINGHVDINKKQAKVEGFDGENVFPLLTRDNDRIEIRAAIDHIVANGIFDEDVREDEGYGVDTGYSETPEYEGYVKGFEHDGYGKSFDSKHKIISEGIWRNSELVEGTMHRCIIQIYNKHVGGLWKDDATGKYFQFMRQYTSDYDEEATISSKFGASKNNIDEFYLTDLRLEKDRFHIVMPTCVSLKSFLENNNQDMLEEIMRESW